MNRLSALLRSLSCPRGRPMASDWEKTWQARAELYDLLDPRRPGSVPRARALDA